MPAGRPKIQLDYKAIEGLSKLHCTQQEISDFLGVSVDTLTRDEKFCGIYKQGIANGRMSLRRKQWQAMEEGNITMLIWLGKQYLGQRELREMDDAQVKAPEIHIHAHNPDKAAG